MDISQPFPKRGKMAKLYSKLLILSVLAIMCSFSVFAWVTIDDGIGLSSSTTVYPSQSQNIVKDSSGNLFAAYQSGTTTFGFSNSSDSGATWSAQEPSTGYSVKEVGIAINSTDGILVYGTSTSTAPDRIFGQFTTDGGQTFSSTITLAQPAENIDLPSIVVDSNDVFHGCAVATDQDAAYYFNSTAWDTETTIGSNANDFTACDIAIGSDNEVYIVAQGTGSDDINIWRVSDGLGWGNKNLVYDGSNFINDMDEMDLNIDGTDIYITNGATTANAPLFCKGSTTDLSSWTCNQLAFTNPIRTPVLGANDDGYVTMIAWDGGSPEDSYQANSTDRGSTWVEDAAELQFNLVISSIRDTSFPSFNRLTSGIDIVAEDTSDRIYYFSQSVDYTAIRFNAGSAVTNTTTPKLNETVEFNATFYDETNDLDSWIFSINLSGTFVNESPSTTWLADGTYNKSRTTKQLNLSRGDVVGWIIYANNSIGEWKSTGTQTLTMANTPPTHGAPSVNATIDTDDLAMCIDGTFSDIDGDSIGTEYYRWYKNGSVLAGETSSTLDLSIAGNGDRDDLISCEWLPDDGFDNSTSGFLFSTNVTISNAVPTTPVIVSPSDGTTAQTVNIQFTSTDADGDPITFYVYINSTTPNVTTTNFTSFYDGDGNYSLFVHADDGFDNSSNTSTIYFVLDQTAPVGGYVSPTPNGTTIGANTFKINVSCSPDEPAGSYTYGVYNSTGGLTTAGGSTGCTFTATPSGLADDTYFFNVTLTDEASNSIDLATQNVTVDTTAPVLAYADPTPADALITATTTHIFNVTHTEINPDTLIFTINGVENESESYVTGFTNYTKVFNDGTYTYNFTANDTVGNTFTTATRTITIDNTPPGFTGNADNSTATTPKTGEDLELNITITETGALSHYILANNQSGTMTNGTAVSISGTSYLMNENVTLTMTKGTFAWQVWANDSLGNSAVSSVFTTTVANTAPATPTILSPSDNDFGNTIDINFTSTDADGDSLTFHVYINSTTANATTTNFTSYTNGDGNYSLKMQVDDGETNSSNTSTIYFLLDTTAPTYSNNITDANATRPKFNDTAQFNLTISDLVEVDSYRFAHNLTGTLENGSVVDVSGATYSLSENFTINATRGSVVWQVWSNDTLGQESLSTLYTLIVANTPGTVQNITLSPTSPSPGDDLTVTYDFADVDGDTEAGVEIRWYNGTSGSETLLSEFNDLTTIGGGNVTLDSSWYVSIRVNDSVEFGEFFNSSSKTIGDDTPPTIVSNTVSPSQVTVSEGAVTFTVEAQDDGTPLDYVRVQTRDPNGDFVNRTLALSNGINLAGQETRWTLNFVPTLVGTWTIKVFVADTNGNIASSVDEVANFAVIAAQGAQQSGGGSSSTTRETIIINQTLTTEIEAFEVCNYNAVCEEGEDVSNCFCGFNNPECGVREDNAGDCKLSIENFTNAQKVLAAITAGTGLLLLFLIVFGKKKKKKKVKVKKRKKK